MLRKVRHTKYSAAADTAEQQCFARPAPVGRRFARVPRPRAVQHGDRWQQHDTADQAAREQECKWANIIHTDALRNERKAPDGSSKE